LSVRRFLVSQGSLRPAQMLGPAADFTDAADVPPLRKLATKSPAEAELSQR
jgi:hypothetical protein